MIDRYDYDVFGILLGSTGPTPNDFRYAGEQYDANLNQIYLRARYLQPEIGRFSTADPDDQSGAAVPRHNYSYADSDPVNRWDPSGRTTVFQNILNRVRRVLGLGFVYDDESALIGQPGQSNQPARNGDRDLTNDPLVRQDVNAAKMLAEEAGSRVGWDVRSYFRYFGRNIKREEVAQNFQLIAYGLSSDVSYMGSSGCPTNPPRVAGALPGIMRVRLCLPEYFSHPRLPQGPFWGVISRAGALIHEFAHIMFGAGDFWYLDNSIDLSRSSNYLTIINADNYRVFAEARPIFP